MAIQSPTNVVWTTFNSSRQIHPYFKKPSRDAFMISLSDPL